MIKAGDLVRIKGKGNQDGWVDSMDDMVGKVYRVSAAKVNPVSYLIDGFCFSEDEIEFVDKLAEREVVRFFSEKQIEEYFTPRLEGMLARECKQYLRGWCEDHKAVLQGNGEYSYEELCNLLIDPWDPVRCLDYLGF